MKKPLLILAFAVAASPALDAKVYSCGNGCYTSNPKAAKGQANLGKQIGSYTGYRDKTKTVDVASIEVEKPTVRKEASPARARPTTAVAAKRAQPSVDIPARSVPVALQKPTSVDTTPRRASGRRTILEQELANERNALAQAQKALADGRVVTGQMADAGHQTRIRQLESTVLDRQQNIQALQRELSRM